MKSMLALALTFGGATLASAQDLSRPLPSVVQSALPATASMPAPVMISQPTNWTGGYQIPLSGGPCPVPQAVGPTCASSIGMERGSACERLRNWLTFRICEPNHASHVPTPYQAPLRAYFPVTPPPIGANGPLDCSPAERKSIFRRTVSVLGLGGMGCSHRGAGCGPMMGDAMCPTDGTCSAPGGMHYHYAGNLTPMLYPGVPAPAAANRPFTNP